MQSHKHPEVEPRGNLAKCTENQRQLGADRIAVLSPNKEISRHNFRILHVMLIIVFSKISCNKLPFSCLFTSCPASCGISLSRAGPDTEQRPNRKPCRVAGPFESGTGTQRLTRIRGRVKIAPGCGQRLGNLFQRVCGVLLRVGPDHWVSGKILCTTEHGELKEAPLCFSQSRSHAGFSGRIWYDRRRDPPLPCGRFSDRRHRSAVDRPAARYRPCHRARRRGP